MNEFLLKNRYLIFVVLFGLLLVSSGYFFFRNVGLLTSSKIEVLEASGEVEGAVSELVVEISGEVLKPGVYRLPMGSRIDDLLIASGGLSGNADRDFVAKNINRAAKLSDGQKIYIPDKTNNAKLITNGYSGGGGVVDGTLVNINSADLKSLDSLSGIGPVYAQNIIEHRPYSESSQLVSKGVIPNNVYLKIKDKISVY